MNARTVSQFSFLAVAVLIVFTAAQGCFNLNSLIPDGGIGGGGGGNNSGDGGTPPASYTVPADGGTKTITATNGSTIDFQFPPSAAGKSVSFTPTTAAAIGWPDGTFNEVIRLEPSGMTFSPAIVVKPGSKDVLLATFPASGQKSPGDALQYSASKGGFLLDHFSTLAVLNPTKACDQTGSGWKATADAGMTMCSGAAGGATTFLEFVCNSYPFCLGFTATCCGQPGSTACKLGDPMLQVNGQWRDTSGTTNKWCDRSVNWNPVDAGTNPPKDGGMMMPTCADPYCQTVSDPNSSFCGNCYAYSDSMPRELGYALACDGTMCGCYSFDLTQRSDAGTVDPILISDFSADTMYCTDTDLLRQAFIDNCQCQ